MMCGQSNADEPLSDRFDHMRRSTEYSLEETIDAITENVIDRMIELDMNRSQLADLLGVSPARVTNLLRGNSNFTLRTLSEMAAALECRLDVNLRPLPTAARAVPEGHQPGLPHVAAESRAAYGQRRPAPTYKSRDAEIREHLKSGKLKVENGVVYMRHERDGHYHPATMRKTGDNENRLRTNVGRRAYVEHRILAVAREMGYR